MEGCIKFHRGTKPLLLSPSPSFPGKVELQQGIPAASLGTPPAGHVIASPVPIPVPVLLPSRCSHQRQPRWLPREHQRRPRHPPPAVGWDKAVATSAHKGFPLPCCFSWMLGLWGSQYFVLRFFDISLVIPTYIYIDVHMYI